MGLIDATLVPMSLFRELILKPVLPTFIVVSIFLNVTWASAFPKKASPASKQKSIRFMP